VRGSEGALHVLRVEPGLSLAGFRAKLQELGITKASPALPTTAGAAGASGGPALAYRLVVVHAGGERESFAGGPTAADAKAFRLECGPEQDPLSVENCGIREFDTVLVLTLPNVPSPLTLSAPLASPQPPSTLRLPQPKTRLTLTFGWKTLLPHHTHTSRQPLR